MEEDFVDGDEVCPHCDYTNYAGFERCMCCGERPRSGCAAEEDGEGNEQR